jgi:uncharacterized protein DUF6982
MAMISRSSAILSHRGNLALVPKVTDAALDLPISDGTDVPWAERRAYERHSIADLSWLNQIRLKYGPAVSLVDLSSGGAQIETTSSRLKPGATVVVELVGGGETIAVPASVLRAQIASLAPHAIYRGALVFRRAIELPTAAARTDSARASTLLHEHARLGLALKKLGGSVTAAQGDGAVHVGEASMAAALALLESPSSRRADGAFARDMTHLLRLLTDDITDGVAHDTMIDHLIDSLRRVVPTRAIRLVDAARPTSRPSAEAIYFDVRSADGEGPAARLLVEFPGGCRLETWHLQFLRAAAHLVTLIKEVDALRRAAEDVAERERSADLPLGWKRLVARFRDGRLIKGYCREFTPARGTFQVANVINGPTESHVTVPLSQLKAVFFVQDFDGRPGPATRPASDPVAECGRRVDVTFVDGEVLSGVTLNYAPDGPGFFMFSGDPSANHSRIFVASGAVRHVRFP